MLTTKGGNYLPLCLNTHPKSLTLFSNRKNYFMKAITITAFTEDESQIEAIKAVLKALKIEFKITKHKNIEPTYNPEFVAKIKKGQKEIAEGKGIKMSIEELKALCK